jgi:hypothetical protein
VFRDASGCRFGRIKIQQK